MSSDGYGGSPDNDAVPRAVSTGVGLYFGLIQLFFALTWVVYVIYLPRLAAEAGISRNAVPWILVLDQLIFALCDWITGIAADRVSAVVGRLGKLVAGVTAVSGLAFLLLPLATGFGAAAFLALVVIWSITSSALRAPPLKLLGSYTPTDQQPWVGSLFLIGTGIAGAVAPLLAGWIAAYDPRIMFAVSSVSVVVVTFSIVHAEKTLARSAPRKEQVRNKLHSPVFPLFLVAIFLLAIGFQVHFFINGGPLFAKFAGPTAVSNLLSLFWIGFTLLMLPASFLTKRFGGITVMALGAFIGAASAWAAMQATDLVLLSISQFISGGAWGCVLMSAIATALAIGHPGREGTANGAVFSLMAAAAVARIALEAGGFEHNHGLTGTLLWLPCVSWLGAGLILVAAARRPRELAPARVS